MYTSTSAPDLSMQGRRLVMLPVGAYEQHGPHLPVDTDLRISQLLTENLVRTLGYTNTICLPPLPFSCSWEHKGIGTLSLSTMTLSALLHDLARSLSEWEGATYLVLLNWHGGNGALDSIAAEISAQEGIPTSVFQSIKLAGEIWNKRFESIPDDVHAGMIETSIVQAYWPELIKTPLPYGAAHVPDIEPELVQPTLQALGTLNVTPHGIWGTLEHASPEKGKALVEALVVELSQQVTKMLELVNKYDESQ